MRYLIGFICGVIISGIMVFIYMDTTLVFHKAEIYVTSSESFHRGFELGARWHSLKD